MNKLITILCHIFLVFSIHNLQQIIFQNCAKKEKKHKAEEIKFKIKLDSEFEVNKNLLQTFVVFLWDDLAQYLCIIT